jgi:outer membrane protein OmpA-like peptidoglycan-associated protein
MRATRCTPALIVGIIFLSSTLIPALCSAQDNMNMQMPQPTMDIEGCADLRVLPKLAGTHIVSCDKADSIEVIMPLKPDAQGNSREKSARGAYEFREYRMQRVSQEEQTFQSMMLWLPLEGFTIKYSDNSSTITARKLDTWVLVSVGGEYYDVKAVRVLEDPWIPVRSAQEISREMEAHKRVAIYGIEFSPDGQAIMEDRSRILGEVLTYLSGRGVPAVTVESHTMTNNSSAKSDEEITQRRVQAVVAWLEAHGVAAGRLRPQALGRSKPVTENDTPMEIQKNNRIELVATAP